MHDVLTDALVPDTGVTTLERTYGNYLRQPDDLSRYLREAEQGSDGSGFHDLVVYGLLEHEWRARS